MSNELFSRAGKHSLNKFKILQEKDAILSNHPLPKFKTISKSLSAPNLSYVNTKKIVMEELERIMRESNTNRPKKHQASPTAAFKAPDRERFSVFEVIYKKTPKDETPGTGCYDVKYDLVQKSPVTYSISSTTREHKTEIIPDLPFVIASEQPRRLKKKFKFPGMKFDGYSDRKPFYEGFPSGHEARFMQSNLTPYNSSKYKTQSFPKFVKYTERNIDKMFRLQKYLPEYKPNKELVLPRIAREISFNKMSERPQLFQEELDLRRDCRINYDLVEKKVMTHVFLKDLPREKNPMSPLPSYLQATMTHDELEQSIMHKRSQYSISYPKLPENSSIYNETLRYSVA